MSQDSEPQLSQGSLAPPVEFNIPANQVQRTNFAASPDLAKTESHTSESEKSKLLSPPPLSSSDMTPPPSTQVPGAPLRRSRSRSRSNSLLESQPNMEKSLCAAYGASENLPTVDDINAANEPQLRAISKDLLNIAQEARMSSLHFKLQHSLLSFSSNEAIKRAEVEHQLARREVEILQSSEYRNRHGPAEIKPLQPISNAGLELALRRNQELERNNDSLDRRLRRAKRLIEQEKVKSDMLNEENQRLKGRIRDNRQHFSLMIEQGSMSLSPHAELHTPRRRSSRHIFYHSNTSNHYSSHQLSREESGLAALLAAGQFADRFSNTQESASVASTPDQNFTHCQHPNGDIHGSNQVLSVPRTPSRSQTAHQQYLTPVGNTRQEQYDRDSTISASDIEEAETVQGEDDEREEEAQGSQASSLATDMLRRNAGSHRQETRSSANVPKTSTLLQTKLFGQVKKARAEPAVSLKRKATHEEERGVKKSKAVGLGIDAWGNRA